RGVAGLALRGLARLCRGRAQPGWRGTASRDGAWLGYAQLGTAGLAGQRRSRLGLAQHGRVIQSVARQARRGMSYRVAGPCRALPGKTRLVSAQPSTPMVTVLHFGVGPWL